MLKQLVIQKCTAVDEVWMGQVVLGQPLDRRCHGRERQILQGAMEPLVGARVGAAGAWGSHLKGFLNAKGAIDQIDDLFEGDGRIRDHVELAGMDAMTDQIGQDGAKVRDVEIVVLRVFEQKNIDTRHSLGNGV